MTWKPYRKDRFSPIGVFIPDNTSEYPDITGGKYVVAICLSKLSADRDVVVGGTYIIKWYDSSTTLKVDAPDPPFHTGETIG